MGRILALIGGALLILAAALFLAKASPIDTTVTLLKGSLGSASAFGGTLREATPLLILGLAVFLALKAGLFNIGVEGQFLLGAMSCAAVGQKMSGVPGIVVGILVGAIAGCFWALPAGLIKAFRNGHEVITTIMLNTIAVYLTDYLVAGPLKDATQQEATTPDVAASMRLPWVVSSGNFQINLSLVLGIVGAIALAAWLRRRVSGYELRAVGANPTAAKFAGISTPMVQLKAMAASGTIAGIAGAAQVLAFEGRFYQGFSPGYGFDALGVALLAGESALGVLPASLLFGVLAKGGTALQADGVPKGITTVILGFLIIIAAAIRYRKVKPVA